MTIEKVRKLFESKKQTIKDEDKEKLSVLQILLNDDNIFFQLDMPTACGILEFLGVDKEKIIDEYMELISPKVYSDNSGYQIEKEEER